MSTSLQEIKAALASGHALQQAATYHPMRTLISDRWALMSHVDFIARD